MAPTDDFKQFYEGELRVILESLNARRMTVFGFGFTATASALGFGGLVATESYFLGPSAVPLLFLTALATLVVAWYQWGKLRRDFKHEVVGRVVKFLDPELRYLPADKIDQEKFEAGSIFRQRIDRYEGEDCVWGTLGVTKFEFCELKVQHQSRGESSKRSHWTTIFKGLYFVADFNKHFQSHTVVLPDALEGALGFLGQALQSVNPMRDDLVRLEDPEFEREFVVYGGDQVEARYILSPALMQRMLALKHKVGGKVYFAFAGSEVHVAMATTRNRFEPKVFKSLLNCDDVAAHLEDLRLIIGLVEDLNLNTRIWSKA